MACCRGGTSLSKCKYLLKTLRVAGHPCGDGEKDAASGKAV